MIIPGLRRYAPARSGKREIGPYLDDGRDCPPWLTDEEGPPRPDDGVELYGYYDCGRLRYAREGWYIVTDEVYCAFAVGILASAPGLSPDELEARRLWQLVFDSASGPDRADHVYRLEYGHSRYRGRQHLAHYSGDQCRMCADDTPLKNARAQCARANSLNK